ncbi:MAG: alanine racemase [Flexilinea sp.]
MKHNAYENWVEIDLEAIRGNIRQISRIAGCPVISVIKANAYGHGTIPVARAAIEAGSNFFAVARFNEAMELRKAGITVPILIFGRLGPEVAKQAADENFRVTVFCKQQIIEYTEALRDTKQKLIVHAKIDTGMGRLGLPVESGLNLLQTIQSAPNLEIEGLFTHFARADELNVNTTDQQLDRFEKLIDTLTENGLRPKIIHTANSAGAIFHPRACQYDMVRGGIAIYGLNPSIQTPLPAEFRPALSWKTEIISVKSMPSGWGISYGHKYLTKRDGDRIGVIPVGYADGFRRTTGNEVLVGRKRVPVLGNVCMDQCMIDLNSVPDARPGDEAVLIGRQGDNEISADEVAVRWGTINYEVTCGVSHRVDRIYL